MEPSEYLGALRRRWVVLVFLALLGGALAYVNAATTTPMYRGTSKVWVSLGRGETVSELAQGSTYVQNLVQSYAQLATMPAVLDPVIRDLDLDTTARDLARQVSADTPLGTVIVEVSAVSADPEEAAAVADAVARYLAITASDLSPEGPDGQASVTMETVARAQVPTVPFSPDKRLATATGILLGLVLGVSVAVLRELLDTKVRTVKDVARVSTSAVLGTIGFERRPKEQRLVMRSDAHSPRAESYRRVSTNLQFLNVERKVRSLVVTSAIAGEGKSTTAINLALAVAENSRRVLLVDADLRRPSVAEYCGIEGAAGLTTVLIGQATIEDVVQSWGHPNLQVLAAGTVPPNPSQLLGSPAMAELVNQLTQSYDVVIIDSAPLLPVADGAILSRVTDGAVVTAGCRIVHRNQLSDALASLEAVKATCLGIVLNRTSNRDTDGYYEYHTPDRPPRRGLFRSRRSAAPIATDLLETEVSAGGAESPKEGRSPEADRSPVPEAEHPAGQQEVTSGQQNGAPSGEPHTEDPGKARKKPSERDLPPVGDAPPEDDDAPPEDESLPPDDVGAAPPRPTPSARLR